MIVCVTLMGFAFDVSSQGVYASQVILVWRRRPSEVSLLSH